MKKSTLSSPGARSLDWGSSVGDRLTNLAESVQNQHQSIIGPEWTHQRPGRVDTARGSSATQWVVGFPDAPTPGFLEGLYSSTFARETDISLHLRPRDTERTLDRLANKIETLEAEADALAEKGRAGLRGVEKDLADYGALYDTLRNTSTRAFDVSLFLSSHAEEDLANQTEGTRKVAKQAPANLRPVTPRWSQTAAMVSGSPVGVDQLAETFDTRTPMLSDAVGTIFPFVAGSFAEPGIEYGRDAWVNSPVMMDRFNRSTGYCMMTIGKLGAGKSFSTKLQLLRRAIYDGETNIVMLDPMREFTSVNDALGGERVVVGGTQQLNPLAIKRTPERVLQEVTDLDPWSERLTGVMSFFETFFETVAANPLGQRTQTLRNAVVAAYRRQGITQNPVTHDQESPTIQTVIDVLEQMGESPSDFGYRTSGEKDRVRTQVQSLLTDLRPSFTDGGGLDNLARSTTFELDSPVIYLDLHQKEGSGSGRTGLMMQVLFNAVYERAKATSNRVLFVIDEAHYLLGDVASREFLETAVRHSRHYDLSLHFVTQTGGEFSLTPETRTIADLCSLVQIHRVGERAAQLAEWFDLNPREVEWVRSARSGREGNGGSEALLSIDEVGRFPIRVRASEYERDVLRT